jgi:hypothetical protein
VPIKPTHYGVSRTFRGVHNAISIAPFVDTYHATYYTTYTLHCE